MGRRSVAQAMAAEDMPRGDSSATLKTTQAAPATASEPEPEPAVAPQPGSVEVVAVFGPTASGKSAVAEALADRLATEIVSADAMQVYRGLPILTNQTTRSTRLVGFVPLYEEMSVGAYAPLAHAAVDELVAARGIAIVAGGTGLYLRAALADLDVPPRATSSDRARIAAEVDADRDAAHRRLAALDATAAARVHPNDRKRLVRALELAEGGRSLVAGQERLWSESTRRPTRIFGIDVPQEELGRRVRARAEDMFRRGVAEEVRTAVEQPLSRTAEKTLGLREIADHDEAMALELIVARTLRYAAYQRKWMRRIAGLIDVDGTRPAATIADEIVDRIAL